MLSANCMKNLKRATNESLILNINHKFRMLELSHSSFHSFDPPTPAKRSSYKPRHSISHKLTPTAPVTPEISQAQDSEQTTARNRETRRYTITASSPGIS